jgi:hypothetical protein
MVVFQRRTRMLRKRKKRYAYIIAYPLKIAGPASWISNGKYPLCHWGLLTTRRKVDTATDFIPEVFTNSPSEAHALHGVMLEFTRGDNTALAAKLWTQFRLKSWHEDRGSVVYVYAGKIHVSDRALEVEGLPLLKYSLILQH